MRVARLSRLAASTPGTTVAVSGVYMTQFFYSRLDLYDRTGATAGSRGTLFGGDSEAHGQGRRVTIDANGRVYWRFDMQWPIWPQWAYMVVFE